MDACIERIVLPTDPAEMRGIARAFDDYLTCWPNNQKMQFRRRVFTFMALGGSDKLASNIGLLALKRCYFSQWEEGGNLTHQNIDIAAPDFSPTESTYELIDGESYTVETRLPSKDDGASHTVVLRNATIVHAVGNADNGQIMHADIVLNNGLGSTSAPPHIANKYISTVYIDKPNQRIFADLEKINNIEHSDIDSAVHLDNWALNNYGHWLLDDLPRLMALKVSGAFSENRLFSPYLASFQLRTLDILGLSDRLIPVKRQEHRADYIHAHHFKTLIIPSLPPLATRLGLIRDAFLPLAPAADPRYERIFISRRKLSSVRIGNEAEVADFLTARGFTVITPESHDILEQVMMYSSARVVVCATGSAYINLAFAHPGTLYLELTGRRIFETIRTTFPHYDMFHQIGVRHAVMVFDNISQNEAVLAHFPINSGFIVDVQRLGRALDKLIQV